MEPIPQSQKPAYRDNWFDRHKVVTCFSIVALFALSLAFFNHNPQEVAVEGASTSIPTATPTAIPSNTPTPTSTPIPTNIPTPSPKVVYISPPTPTTPQDLQSVPCTLSDGNTFQLTQSGCDKVKSLDAKIQQELQQTPHEITYG